MKLGKDDSPLPAQVLQMTLGNAEILSGIGQVKILARRRSVVGRMEPLPERKAPRKIPFRTS
jgi:hypothetical protein